MPVLSPVIEQPQDWADESVLRTNEAIRLMTVRVRRAIEKVNSLEYFDHYKWLSKMLSFYNKFFFPILDAYLEGQQKVYFPWIQAKASLGEEMQMMGEELRVANEDLNSFALRFIDPKNQSVSMAFDEMSYKEAMPKLNAILGKVDEYLQQQEQGIPGILRTEFDEKEEQKTFIKLQRSYKKDVTRMFAPLIYDALTKWKGKDGAAKWRSSLPVSFKYTVWKSVDEAYEQKHKKALKELHALEEGEEIADIQPRKSVSYRVRTLSRSITKNTKDMLSSMRGDKGAHDEVVEVVEGQGPPTNYAGLAGTLRRSFKTPSFRGLSTGRSNSASTVNSSGKQTTVQPASLSRPEKAS